GIVGLVCQASIASHRSSCLDVGVPMPSGAILACVSGLSYQYAPHEPIVLRDISLTIREGEVVVLTGPSGSGKTTLLSLLGMLRRVGPGHIPLFDTAMGGGTALQKAAVPRCGRCV